MSALIVSRHKPVRRIGLFYSSKQTSFASSAWVEMGQTLTSGSSFEQLISTARKRQWDKCLGGFQV
jgi:hypothetical protein